MNSPPDIIYLERHLEAHPLTKKIINKLPSVPVVLIDDYKTINLDKDFKQRADEDKNSLAIAEKKGEVVKSIGRMDDGQYYLFHEIDCKYDCEYCYLQYYFQTKVPVIFVNRDEVLRKMEEILKNEPNPYFHVGEVCDSLAFDYLTDFSSDIAHLFLQYENGKVEFRTKSTNIENLLKLERVPSNLIPSWTISPEYVAEKIEHKTPGFSQRLEAARRCQEHGFTVGIRLDPIFNFEGWEKHYSKMVKDIFSVLDPDSIDYITLGTVKVQKNLLDVLNKRFPDSLIHSQEIVPSSDGKFKPIKFDRVNIYRNMSGWIKDIAPGLSIDLSIESPEVRELVFG